MKSGSARSDVLVSEAVGVRAGVACCDRGLKKGGGGGIVVVKLDVISGIAKSNSLSKGCSALACLTIEYQLVLECT
ncbi:hypothetical protein Tco_1184162 [Tanacetum coccineum]